MSKIISIIWNDGDEFHSSFFVDGKNLRFEDLTEEEKVFAIEMQNETLEKECYLVDGEGARLVERAKKIINGEK